MDLYNLEFKHISSRHLTRTLDKRYLSVIKISTITFVLEIIAGITIIAFNHDVFSKSPGDSAWGVILLVLICVAIAQSFFTLLYGVDEGFEWNRERKTESVNWRFDIPIEKKHAWHPTYQKAMTDLYWQANRSNQMGTQLSYDWIETFDELNVAMKDLTEDHEAITRLAPNAQDYLNSIALEKELTKPTGEYSLGKLLGDFPD